jgi:Flp pilus assembly protein TadB
MDLQRFRGLRSPVQIALIVAPGVALIVAGLVVLGGVATGIGALLVIVALLLWPLVTADDDAAA